MKPFFLLLAACVLLGACSGSTGADPAALADRAVGAQEALPEMRRYDETSPTFPTLLERVYGLDPDDVVSGCLYAADGARAEEALVLRLRDQQAASRAEEALEEYARSRYATFAGYAPEMSDMVEEREIRREGDVVVLTILPDQSAAASAISEALGGAGPAPDTPASSEPSAEELAQEAPSPEPTPYTQLYDHDAVVAAVRAGDPAGLAGQNEAVYYAVMEFLGSRVSEDMTPYEKEVAAHDWILERADYDPGAMSRNDGLVEESPFNDTPYGALITGKAKCYGYSSSFQLLMDILDIPCVTIDGAAVDWEREHSWNAARLDGKWYLVDVAWDDPMGADPYDRYLNQTERFFEENGPHLWDKEAVPEIADVPYAPAQARVTGPAPV